MRCERSRDGPAGLGVEVEVALDEVDHAARGDVAAVDDVQSMRIEHHRPDAVLDLAQAVRRF